jgi:cytochrome b6-f complex iron-sulfur subunit
MAEEKKRSRRFFLTGGLVLLASAGAGAAAYAFSRLLSAENVTPHTLPQKESSALAAGDTDARRKSISLEAGSIPPGGSAMLVIGTTPVIAIRGEDGITAFHAACTHLGCLVQWNKDGRQFICPCHEGVYDANGRVVSGPPPRDLKRCRVETMKDKIEIHLF